MRISGCVYFTVSLACLSAADDAPADNAEPGIDDLDLDLEGEDASSSGSAEVGDTPGLGDMPAQVEIPIEDFDEGMPEEDRRKRMRACMLHTTNRVQIRREVVQQTVQEMVEQQQMKQEQAINALLVTWQMSCYMNIKPADVGQARRGGSMTPEMEQDLFSQGVDGRQTVQQASQRQWKLLESVLVEAQREAEAMGSRPEAGAKSATGASSAGGARRAAPASSTGQQWMYLLLVFGAIFGLGIFVVTRLGRKEKETERERTAKSQKKAEKAERKLAKKKN